MNKHVMRPKHCFEVILQHHSIDICVTSRKPHQNAGCI